MTSNNSENFEKLFTRLDKLEQNIVELTESMQVLRDAIE